MKIEKLSKLKIDVDYIDPVTMEKTCSFNQCIDKFTVQGTDQITTYPKWKDGLPLVKTSYFHACSDCGRRHISKLDKKKNVDSFYDAATGGGSELNKINKENQ